MPTNISWATETLGILIAQAWACACGWIGKAEHLKSNASGGNVCPECGASTALDYEHGGLDLRKGWHCERVSPGCGGGSASPEYAELIQLGERSGESKGGCYAEAMNEAMRWGRGTGLPYNRASRDKVDIVLDEDALLKPLSWKKPRIIFWLSMSDWCAEFFDSDWRDKILAVTALTPQHRHLLLTKRAAELRSYLTSISALKEIDSAACEIMGNASREIRNRDWDNALPIPGVWLGFSAENQEVFNSRWASMKPLAALGWNVWCSFEPLLSPIDAHDAIDSRCQHCGMTIQERIAEKAAGGIPTPCFHQRLEPRISYAVCGGESGTGYRAMKLGWMTDLAAQLQAAHVPVHIKQDSGLYPGKQGRIPDDLWKLKASMADL